MKRRNALLEELRKVHDKEVPITVTNMTDDFDCQFEVRVGPAHIIFDIDPDNKNLIDSVQDLIDALEQIVDKPILIICNGYGMTEHDFDLETDFTGDADSHKWIELIMNNYVGDE
ncbi:MAG: hypothetical protein ACTSW1_07490 [Candidatus Hodarchaeales archaeon]